MKRDYIPVELYYPRNNKIMAIQLDLIDVRASDGIRIEYDFERDGWIIKQPQVLEWDVSDKECDPKWVEVAFIESWRFTK